MGGTDEFLERLGTLISHLNETSEWNLDQTKQRAYAEALSVIISSQRTDDQIAQHIKWYHLDHEQVEALLQSEHHDHDGRWAHWIQQIGIILRSNNIPWGATLNHCTDDMAQDVIVEVIKSLKTFGYCSRLATWIFAITLNTVRQKQRKDRAGKRQAVVDSLDGMVQGNFPDQKTDGPEEAVELSLLYARIMELLQTHPDRRVPKIFELHAMQDQTLNTIGGMFNLGTTRIYNLLKKIYEQLRDDPDIQRWWDEYHDR